MSGLTFETSFLIYHALCIITDLTNYLFWIEMPRSPMSISMRVVFCRS
jgi:hypothetical protein